MSICVFFSNGSNLLKMCVHRLCCSCVLVKCMLIDTAYVCIHDGSSYIGEKVLV